MNFKNIKSFEAYSVNEEENWFANKWKDAKEFTTGHRGMEDRDNKRDQIMADLDKYEKMASDNSNIVFKRETLERQARENNYKGKVHLQNSPRSGKTFVVYKKGFSKFDHLAGAAGGATRTMRESVGSNHKKSTMRKENTQSKFKKTNGRNKRK